MHELPSGRYRSLVPIRCRGVLHFYSGRDCDSDRLRVIVLAPRASTEDARALLGNLARVHRLVAGENIPGVAAEALDAPTPWIALDCAAIADHESATEFIRHSGDMPKFEQAAALGKTIMETLVRTHRVRDPETGRPICLGSLASANLLLAEDGKISIVGFGGCALSGACIAPEVASGAPATPGADVYALTIFLRAQLEFVKTPPIIRRVLVGKSLARDAKLLLLFAWSNLKILAAPAPKRPGMEATLKQAQEMWRLLGFEPDLKGLEAWVAHAIASDPERLADAPEQEQTPRILIGRDAEWLETPNGMRHAMGARRPLRRLLVALAETRRDRAGTAVTVEDLLQAGWPGENPLPEAGSNRVYVAISTLRKLGLGEMLQRWDGGYRLDPGVPCQFKDP